MLSSCLTKTAQIIEMSSAAINSNSSELAQLNQLLLEVELSQFATKIVEDLQVLPHICPSIVSPFSCILFVYQVSRISHFDYVTTEDLMGIGMGKPAARRLLDAVKKRKGTFKKKIIQTLINPQSTSSIKDQKINTRIPEEHSAATFPTSNFTCLIKESVSITCYSYSSTST